MSDREQRSRARACASRLVHDVGKYIERGALNVGDQPVVPALAALIESDLYALAPGQSASARFAELSAGLGPAADSPKVARCRQLLAEIDALEPRVRAGEQPALRLAASHARQIASLLREFARQLNEEPA